MQWITKIQTYYYEIVEQTVVQYTNVEEQEQIKQESDATFPFLKLAKVKLPHFDGELRHYPQFKRHFNKQVITQIRAMDAAYVLRSCLGKEPESLVKSIDNDVQEMWRRPDEKYGDPAKIADVIIDSIRRFRTLKEGEDKRFIELVTIVEDGYKDLSRLVLEAEITTTSSVSIKNKLNQQTSEENGRKWLVVTEVTSTNQKSSPVFFNFCKMKGALLNTTVLLFGRRTTTNITEVHRTIQKASKK